MNRADVHAFWRNPETGAEASAKYKAACQPEHYVPLKDVSDMWVAIFKKYVPRDAAILELGCSVGRNLNFLRRAGYPRLTGVEINGRAVGLATRHFGPEIANLITISSIEDYLMQAVAFDVVFTSGVLMHIHPDSEWIFERMADAARRLVMIAEVEKPTGPYRWARQYRPIFEGFGFEQVHEQEATPMSPKTTLRVFRKGVVQTL